MRQISQGKTQRAKSLRRQWANLVGLYSYICVSEEWTAFLNPKCFDMTHMSYEGIFAINRTPATQNVAWGIHQTFFNSTFSTKFLRYYFREKLYLEYLKGGCNFHPKKWYLGYQKFQNLSMCCYALLWINISTEAQLYWKSAFDFQTAKPLLFNLAATR